MTTQIKTKFKCVLHDHGYQSKCFSRLCPQLFVPSKAIKQIRKSPETN